MPGRVYVLVWAVSLFTLSMAAERVTFPGYMDSAYYYHVAQNLAEGRGLVEDFVWNYLSGTPDLPAPASRYWPPLTSLVAVPAMALFGPSFRSAQLVFILLGSLAPVVTFWLGVRLLHDGRGALTAAFLTLFAGFYFGYWVAVDSFALFLLLVTPALVIIAGLAQPPAAVGGPAVSVALSSGPSRNGSSPHSHTMPVPPPTAAFGNPPRQRGRGGATVQLAGLRLLSLPTALRQDSPALGLAWLAGLLTGGAHLARADGALVLAVAVLVLLASRRWRRTALLTAAMLVGYLTVMLPWLTLARGAMAGETSAVELALRAALLREYNQLYAFYDQPSLAGLLALGPGGILWSRLTAVTSNLLDFFGGVFFLAPLTALGLWRVRHEPAWRPFLVYSVLLFTVMSLVFAFPGMRGSFRHSASALLPWLAVATVAGLRSAVTWAAARLPNWEVERATQNFGMVLLAGAAALSLVTFQGHLTTWGRSFNNYVEIVGWLRQQPPVEGPVMVTNPPLFTYLAGQTAVAAPSDGTDAVLAVADRYGVRLLALESDHARALDGLYRGETHHERLALVGTAGRTQMFSVAPAPSGAQP